MDVPETDSEDEIPPGWEERCTIDGLVFYVEHGTKTTQWTHPRTGKKKRVTGELPYGWERQINEKGKVVFLDHTTNQKTYTDPRLAFAVEQTDNISDLRQRFDGSSNAMQVIHGRDLSDQVAIVTGANCGIGFETAQTLASCGCRVVFACRNIQRAEIAINNVVKEFPSVRCYAMKLDLSSLHSVKLFSEQFIRIFGQLNILILNAGIMGVPFMLSENCFELTFQVNFLSHFYLALMLQPLLNVSKPARIVFISSESHRFSSISSASEINEGILSLSKSSYSSIVAYNNSKLWCILGAFEIQRRFGDSELRCFAVHPGNLVSTNLSRNWWLYRLIFAIVRPFVKSLMAIILFTAQYVSLIVFPNLNVQKNSLPALSSWQVIAASVCQVTKSLSLQRKLFLETKNNI